MSSSNPPVVPPQEFARQMRRHPTKAEAALWERLRRKALGVRFHRQFTVLRFVADFWCASRNLVVEVDGSAHTTRRDYDARREAEMAELGIVTIRFTNRQILKDADTVVAAIRREVDRLAPGPSVFSRVAGRRELARQLDRGEGPWLLSSPPMERT